VGRHLAVLAPLVVAVGLLVGFSRSSGPPPCFVTTYVSAQHPSSRTARHLEYVFPDGAMCVYDIDRGQRLVQAARLPGAWGIRGAAVSPATHTLYVSYGGDGGENGSGFLLKYDLRSDRIIWRRSYSSGIDSMAISRDGRRIYMPTGELSSSGVWNVLDARTGRVVGSIDAGAGPHNTIVGLAGGHVYLGGRNFNYLEVASTKNNRVVEKIGPLRSGVRPFTITGRETIAYTTATGFLGFQVSSITTGRVLYTVSVKGFTFNDRTFEPSAPSHGISLSPTEKEIWLIDAPNSYVHVFDVSGVPASPPRQVADIKLSKPMTGDESPCAYDCARDGWVQHSRNGRFVYVGDAGDVISTRTRRTVANLSALRNSRKHLEIDWKNGRPVATTTRSGLGYVR
jgi:hypothetical protein